MSQRWTNDVWRSGLGRYVGKSRGLCCRRCDCRRVGERCGQDMRRRRDQSSTRRVSERGSASPSTGTGGCRRGESQTARIEPVENILGEVWEVRSGAADVHIMVGRHRGRSGRPSFRRCWRACIHWHCRAIDVLPRVEQPQALLRCCGPQVCGHSLLVVQITHSAESAGSKPENAAMSIRLLAHGQNQLTPKSHR